jgi:hypothetical protein
MPAARRSRPPSDPRSRSAGHGIVLRQDPAAATLERMTALPDRDPPSPLTADSSLGAVIAEFVRATAAGVERRELRSALSHVDAELGTMPVRSVRTRHITALLDGLRRAGLSVRREAAIVEALHSLFAFAVARRLVAVDPVPGSAPPRRRERPRGPGDASLPAPTPTLTMLAVGARVAFWTALIVALGFVLLVLALLVELG